MVIISMQRYAKDFAPANNFLKNLLKFSKLDNNWINKCKNATLTAILVHLLQWFSEAAILFLYTFIRFPD